MNIHLPAILMFARGTRFWHTAICILGPYDRRFFFVTPLPSPTIPYHPLALWSLQAIADLDKLFAKIVIASADFGLPQGHPGWPEGLGDA